jgi:hypothetical protein
MTSDGTNWTSATPAASGTVSSGLINQLAWYAASGTTVSGLTIVNSAGLTTTAGGVPTWVTATGTGAPVLGTAPTISNPKINAINDQTFNLPVLSFINAASSVNSIIAVASATGNATGFQFTGTDANVNATFGVKGSGIFTFANNLGGTANNILILAGASTSVNGFTITSALTTASPSFAATGTDTNISGTIDSKGTGRIAIKGIGTNTAAAAGYIGEFLSSTILSAAAIGFTNTVVQNLTSITLTAGDWDVWGNVGFSGTTCQTGQAGVSTTTGALPDNAFTQYINGAATAPARIVVPPHQRFLVSTSTIVYMVGFISGTGTLKGYGGIYARRRS